MDAIIGISSEKKDASDTRQRKYAYTWDGGGHARGQKSFQIHFFCIRCGYMTFSFHSVSLLGASKGATELRFHKLIFPGP